MAVRSLQRRASGSLRVHSWLHRPVKGHSGSIQVREETHMDTALATPPKRPFPIGSTPQGPLRAAISDWFNIAQDLSALRQWCSGVVV
eukprot:4488352-Pyramimonas_sp.AAC.2